MSQSEPTLAEAGGWREEAPLPAPRSAVVTAAGVFTMIMGVLGLLLGICSVAGFMMASIMSVDRGGGPRGEFLVILLGMVIAFVILVWGGASLAAGIGLLNRRPWARVLTLILAAVLAIIALMGTAASFIFTFAEVLPERGARVLMFLLYFGISWLSLLYCVWTYFVLLTSRYREEFR